MNLNATLIIEVLSFLIFTGVLTRLVYKPLLNFMDSRKEKIKTQKEEAEGLVQKAQNYKDETEKILHNAKEEILTLREESKSQASRERLQLLKEAKAEAQRVIEQGRYELSREAEKARDRLKKDVMDLSITMAQKVLAEEIDKDTHKKLFAKSIDKLSHAE
jgi:F-type H+-transporting ATPase subunit b